MSANSKRVTKRQTARPVWLMGLSGTSFGMIGGFYAFVLAQCLAARHVPETTIASVTAVSLSPSFWSFLLSPVLDVWLSRRFYALLLMAVSTLLVGISVLLLDRLIWFEVTATVAFAANQLYYSALGGWFSTVCDRSDENRLSAWLTVANILGFGLMAILGGEVMRNLPVRSAALVISGCILLPMLLLIGVPAPGPDRRLAKESFRAFWTNVFELLRRREVLFALLLFAAPCATFSLTNLVAGLGGDFKVSPRVIGILGGAGTAVAGVFGSLLLPKLAKRVRLRPLYLAIGIIGSLFTVGLLLLPRDVASFAFAVCGENVFQSLAIACSTAITFEIIGEDNPLAATNFALLSGVYNIPIFYMLFVDGWGYGRWGVSGAFAVDAALGGGACFLMAMLLRSFGSQRITPREPEDP